MILINHTRTRPSTSYSRRCSRFHETILLDPPNEYNNGNVLYVPPIAAYYLQLISAQGGKEKKRKERKGNDEAFLPPPPPSYVAPHAPVTFFLFLFHGEKFLREKPRSLPGIFCTSSCTSTPVILYSDMICGGGGGVHRSPTDLN